MRTKKIEVYGITIRVPKDLEMAKQRPKLAKMLNSPGGFRASYAWQRSVAELNPTMFVKIDDTHYAFNYYDPGEEEYVDAYQGVDTSDSGADTEATI